ncbi:hypothetical protein ACQKEN_18255 [Pseudomonas sp. NPDC078416]|uniref:hypothetical protein n=1 Tax=Pseudomonas sp. NPDC078416 TaxID=3390637 RepID=UPI003D01DEF3
MMIKRYTAVFLIPIGANKTLGEDGWEFKSPKRLSKEVVEQLISALRLNFIELYSGIKRYVGDDIGMSIFLDDMNEVENIYFQVFGNSLKALTELCQDPQMSSEAEMFVPEKK